MPDDALRPVDHEGTDFPAAAQTAPRETGAERLLGQLAKLHTTEIDYSLDRMHRLLADLGHPERALPPVIHVAGTNGKGSTIALMRAILEAGGLRVHTYTSPHLMCFNERIRLAGTPASRVISDGELEDALAYCRDVNRGRPITQFEAATAAAFHLFATHEADVVLLEAGMGGRCDATNVVPKPAATVITSISLDHEAYLGSSISSIAGEKAGILRAGVPVVIGPQPNIVADQVICRAACVIGAPVIRAGRDFSGRLRNGRFVYADAEGARAWPLPGLAGLHQIDNAATAIAAVSAVGFLPEPSRICLALPQVSWPGRLQSLCGRLSAMLPHGTEVLLDGAHNPGAAAAIAHELRRRNEIDRRSTVLVLGMLASKDAAAFLMPFRGMVSRVLTVPLRAEAASQDTRDLAETATDIGLPSHATLSIPHAVGEIARVSAIQDLRVLFTGSLHLAGEVLALDASPLDPVADHED